MKKKFILNVMVLVVLALVVGCNKDSNDGIVKEVENFPQEEAIMTSFEEFSGQRGDVIGIRGLVEQNISKVSRESASRMVDTLDILQRLNINDFAEIFFVEGIQKKFAEQGYTNPTSEELIGLIEETKVSGYKVETSEGIFYPVIDYSLYTPYKEYVTDDMAAYIDIMAKESDNPSSADAALIIRWDEVIERALEQERFLTLYKDSSKYQEIQDLHYIYTTYLLYGLNNTPLFDYETNTMSQEAREAYEKAIQEREDTPLLKTIKEYMRVIKENDYNLTKKVEAHRKSVLQKES